MSKGIATTAAREHILSEIRRLAAASGGTPPGIRTFEHRTGIRHGDWFGIHWRSWGEAIREAGLEPNTLTQPRDEADLLERYALLARELGRQPVKGDLRLQKRRDPTFPSDTVFIRRFGSYPGLREKARDYCTQREHFADVVPLLILTQTAAQPDMSSGEVYEQTGFVYLIKHGARSEYKIGKTINPLRREGEMRLQLPEQLRPIHYIETDDPAGVETYWHNRFRAKQKEGEWFELSASEVRAFKKWKRIV